MYFGMTKLKGLEITSHRHVDDAHRLLKTVVTCFNDQKAL